MNGAMGKRRLEVLDVKEPCDEQWGAMSGDERVRHCAVCEQSVYDLSAMRESEAIALLERPGRVCVRFYRRADGRVTTKDCLPFRVRAARAAVRGTLRGAAMLASATMALIALLGIGAIAGFSPLRWVESLLFGHLTMGEPVAVAGAVAYEPEHEPEMVMGEMATPSHPLPPVEIPPVEHSPAEGAVPGDQSQRAESRDHSE